MSTLTADNALQAYLAPLKEATEIRDESGKLLGVYQPIVEEGGTSYHDLRQRIDPKEIKRRKERSKSDSGSTLDQIMQRLHLTEKPS
jgi:hypothetical protein